MFDPSEYILIMFMVTGLVGYQISAYFIYQYIKLGKEKSRFSIILVYFGIIYATVMFGVITIALAQAFTDDIIVKQQFWRISIGIMYVGISIFIIGMVRAPFKELINLKITISLIVLIPFSIGPLIFEDIYLIFLVLGYIIRIIGAVYFMVVQLKIISLSYGNIKKRLKLILFSHLCVLFSMYIVNILNNLGLTIGIVSILPLVIFLWLALLITFIAMYQFPLFIEFNWNKKIERFIVFNQKTHDIYYYYNFKDIEKTRPERDSMGEIKELMSSSYQGIQRIVSEAGKRKMTQIFKIQVGDKHILYENSSQINKSIVFALIVQEEIIDLRYFLKTLKHQFLDYYKFFLVNPENIQVFDGIKIPFFSGFDKILEEKFI